MSQIPLKSKLGNYERVFAQEYVNETGHNEVDSFFFPKSDVEFWWCVCSHKNSIKSMTCGYCGIDIRKLSKMLSKDYLKSRIPQKTEEQQIRINKQNTADNLSSVSASTNRSDKPKAKKTNTNTDEKKPNSQNELSNIASGTKKNSDAKIQEKNKKERTDNTTSQAKKIEFKKCPECNGSVPGTSRECPECGYPFVNTESNDRRRCRECGEILQENIGTCPICGFDNSSSLEKNEKFGFIKKNKKKIGIVCLIASIICILLAVTRITSEKYKWNKEQYSVCEKAQQECINEKGSTLSWLKPAFSD